MTKFADQLFQDLMREHGAALQSPSEQTPARARRRAARPAWLTAAVAAATGAVAAGFVLFGGGGTAAYAVTQNPNGTVSVAVRQASAIGAVNARLKVLGVRVVLVPVHAGCPSMASLAATYPQGDTHISVSPQTGDHSSATIDVKDVPAHTTMVLGFDSSSGELITAIGAIVEGTAPSCISLPGPGPFTPVHRLTGP